MDLTMTENTQQPAVRLWTPNGFAEDRWRHAESADELAETGQTILSLEAFLGLDDEVRRTANRRLGVRLKPGEPVEKIADYLPELPVVALEFPAFSDGRSFSKAEILRRRYGFEGKVRAVGQVLPDQLSHMLRVGFDEFEVSHPVTLRWIDEGRTKGLGIYGQPSARADTSSQKYSWRRKPA